MHVNLITSEMCAPFRPNLPARSGFDTTWIMSWRTRKHLASVVSSIQHSPCIETNSIPSVSVLGAAMATLLSSNALIRRLHFYRHQRTLKSNNRNYVSFCFCTLMIYLFGKKFVRLIGVSKTILVKKCIYTFVLRRNWTQRLATPSNEFGCLTNDKSTTKPSCEYYFWVLKRI